MRDLLFGFFAVATTGVTAWLGGWDKALQVLTVLMVFDYMTGVASSIKGKKINSDIMFWGGLRKAIILAVIGLCVQFDAMLGNEAPVFRTLAIYYYTARELVSVTENLGKLGVPLPPFVKQILAQLEQKGGNDNDPTPKI